MTLEDLKNTLYRERQAVDALATTVKNNTASLMAIVATIAIPLVPALFAANGIYVQTAKWADVWRVWAAISVAIAIEGAGMFLSILATKTYSAWRKKIATIKEVWATGVAVVLYTIIVIVLISFSDIPPGLKFTVALVPLLGVAFYIGMGFETDLANRLDEQAAEKRQRRDERLAAKQPQIAAKQPQNPSIPREEWRNFAVKVISENPQISGARLAARIGSSERTGQNILNELERSGVISKNGNGWMVHIK